MKHSPLNFFTALSVSTLVMAGMGLPNHAYAAWSSPANLQAFTLFGLPVNSASVAVNAAGNGVAVWIDETTGKVMYTLQKAGKWTGARALYVPSVNKNETTDSARVVMQADGTALAVFSTTTPGPLQYCASGLRVFRCYGPGKSFAKVATLKPGATTWTKLNISAQGISVRDTQIGLDQYGNATVSWTYLAKAGAPLALQVATKSPAMAWSAPVTVHSTANALSKPSMSVGFAGHAVLAWQEQLTAAAGASYKICAVFSDNAPAGSWNAPEDVSTLTNPTWTLRTAIDGVGNSALVWDENYSIEWARRSCNAICAWNGQTLVSASADHSIMAFSPDIAVDAQGNFLLAWGKVSSAGNTIEARLHQVDGQVMTAWWYGNSDPRVSMSPDGSVGLVGWIDDNDYSAHTASFTSTQNQPVIWTQQPEVLLGQAVWGSQIALGTADAGHASTIWLDTTGREFVYKYLGSFLR
ncbi:MAG: hypothetical protein ACXWTS_06395 [Methylococcaceae bacterium]